MPTAPSVYEMTIEIVPLPLPPSGDAAKLANFGREVKGVDPGSLTEEQFKEVEGLLYKVLCYAFDALGSTIDVACYSILRCSFAM